MAQLNINALAEMMSQTAGQTIGGVSRGIKQQKAVTQGQETQNATAAFELEQKQKESEMKAQQDQINAAKRAALSPYLRVQPFMDGTLADANGDGVVSDAELASVATKVLGADLNRPGMTAEEKMATEKLLQTIKSGSDTGDYSAFMQKVGLAQKGIDELAAVMPELQTYTTAALRESAEQRRQSRETAVKEGNLAVNEGRLALDRERRSAGVDAPGKTETEFDKAIGKGAGERADARVNQASETIRQDAQLDQLDALLAQTGPGGTGAGTETILQAKSLASTLFGLEFGEEVPAQEAVRQIQSEMALRLRNPESGLGLTGNTSNRDLEFLKAAVPGLTQTPAGNKMIIQLMRQRNQMARDIAAEQARLLRSGVSPEELDVELIKFANDYQMLDEAQRQQISQMTGGSSTGQPAAQPIEQGGAIQMKRNADGKFVIGG